MKKIVLFIIVLCAFGSAHAQDGPKAVMAKTFVESKFSDFLVEGDVIMSQEDIFKISIKGGKRNREQRIHDFFIKKFKMPNNFVDFAIQPEFSYPEMPISSFGSMVFNAATLGGDVTQVQAFKLPTLLASSDYTQVHLADLDDNNYQLNVNLLSYMNWMMAAGGDADIKSVITAKAEVAIRKTFQDKKSISIVYGHFENSLAKVFSEVKNTKRLANKADFAPLFDLWLQYSANPQAVTNKFIIDDFTALLISETSDATFLGDNKADAMADLKVNIPFLKLNASTQYSWKNEREVRRNARTVGVYFKGSPNFIALPTPSEIAETWEGMSVGISRVIYPDGKTLSVSDFQNEELIVRVPFGPIPGNVVLTDLSVREVKSQQQLTYVGSLEIAGPPEPNDVNNGLYNIPVRINLDRDKIRQNAKLNEPLSVSTNLEVFYKKAVNIDGNPKRLSIRYPLSMYINSGPAPRITSCTLDKAAANQKWTIEIMTTEEVGKLSVNKIDFKLAPLETFQQTLQTRAIPIKDANNPKKWTMTFESDLLERAPNYGNKIQATFTFSIARAAADVPNLRASVTDFDLRYKEDPKVGEEIVANSIDNLNLVTNLSDTVKVLNGQSAVALLNKAGLTDETKQQIVTELVKKQIIKVRLNNYVMVKSKD